MEQQMTLGKRIAMLRRNQGWTQEQLGEKVGVSAQAVSKWENDLACPDITTLPLLADLFGVTTDELLGVKPIEPHVVVLDKEPEEEKKGKGSFEIHLDHDDKWGAIAFCITAILVCVMLITRSTTDFFHREGIGTWNYIWPILVFGAGLGFVRKKIVFGITLMAIGAYEFVWFGWGVPFEIKWYVFLLVLAVAVLVRILLEKLNILPETHEHVVTLSDDKPRVCEWTDNDEFLRAELSFGHNAIAYSHEQLRGMKLETNFGDHKIDLSGVKSFLNDPVLDVEVNFGNVVILLPENVRIHKNSEAAFGACQIKGMPSHDADQIAYLKGDVSFGNLELRYPNA